MTHQAKLRSRIKVLLNLSETGFSKKLKKYIAELKNDFPDEHLAKAALSYVNNKVGLIEEAENLVEQSLSSSKNWLDDPETVHYYTNTMKALNRIDLLEKLWSDGVEIYSQKNRKVEMQEKLFSILIRNNNYNEQSKLAMKIYKLTNDQKYLFWSIVSRVQGELVPDLPHYSTISRSVANQNSSQSSNLTLTKNMMEMLLNSDKITTHLQANFLLRLYVQLGLYKEALNMLQNPKVISLYKIEYQILQEIAALLYLTERFDESSEKYLDLIHNHNHDQWCWYEGYLDSNFNSPQLDATRAQEMIKTLNDLASKFPHARSPNLALVEFEKRYSRHRKESFNSESLTNYINTFKDKSCCFHDIKIYLPLVEDENFSDSITIPEDSVEIDKKILRMQAICNKEGIKYSLRNDMNARIGDDSSWHVPSCTIALWEIYKDALKISYKNESSGRFIGDDLLLISCHYILDSYLMYKDINALYLILIVLKYGLCKSRYNFQFQLFLVAMYRLLGFFNPVVEILGELDIKNMQLESLSYIFLDTTMSLASWKHSHQILKKILSLYYENDQQSENYIIEAYRYGNYQKVKEISDFSKNIENSRNHAASKLANVNLKLFQSTTWEGLKDVLREYRDIEDYDELKNLSTNYETKVMDSWDVEDAQKNTFQLLVTPLASPLYPDHLQISRLKVEKASFQLLKQLYSPEPLKALQQWEKVESALEESLDEINALDDSNLILNQQENILSGEGKPIFDKLMLQMILNFVKLMKIISKKSSSLPVDTGIIFDSVKGIMSQYETQILSYPSLYNPGILTTVSLVITNSLFRLFLLLNSLISLKEMNPIKTELLKLLSQLDQLTKKIGVKIDSESLEASFSKNTLHNFAQGLIGTDENIILTLASSLKFSREETTRELKKILKRISNDSSKFKI